MSKVWMDIMERHRHDSDLRNFSFNTFNESSLNWEKMQDVKCGLSVLLSLSGCDQWI
jgi:hypothetical protein